MQIVGIYDIIDENCHVRKKNIEILVKRLFTKKDMTNFFGNLFNKSFFGFSWMNIYVRNFLKQRFSEVNPMFIVFIVLEKFLPVWLNLYNENNSRSRNERRRKSLWVTIAKILVELELGTGHQTLRKPFWHKKRSR